MLVTLLVPYYSLFKSLYVSSPRSAHSPPCFSNPSLIPSLLGSSSPFPISGSFHHLLIPTAGSLLDDSHYSIRQQASSFFSFFLLPLVPSSQSHAPCAGDGFPPSLGLPWTPMPIGLWDRLSNSFITSLLVCDLLPGWLPYLHICQKPLYSFPLI